MPTEVTYRIVHPNRKCEAYKVPLKVEQRRIWIPKSPQNRSTFCNKYELHLHDILYRTVHI